MKRNLVWFMSTLSAIVVLFGYKTSTSSTFDAVNAAASSHVATGSTPTPAAGKAATSAHATAAPSAQARETSAKKSVTGPVVQTRWGPVQVQLTLVRDRIAAVSVLQHPTGGRSDEINAQALPILVDETLKDQSAKIDMVSGATYTSTGYLQSLQSALDRAGV